MAICKDCGGGIFDKICNTHSHVEQYVRVGGVFNDQHVGVPVTVGRGELYQCKKCKRVFKHSSDDGQFPTDDTRV